uniref:Uncharacterized protein n=1 Tax=Arundo donax TaxID=35708 RepID=A0A0A9A9V1_ARUDO
MPRRSRARASAARRELKAETSGGGAPTAREARRKLAAGAGEGKRARSVVRSGTEGGGRRCWAGREWRSAREAGLSAWEGAARRE